MSWNTDIWPSLNSRDSFPRRKFENRAPICCRSGPTLSLPTTSFELHAKVAEQIDLEMCGYGQLSEVQMLHDFHLDLGSGQGHISIHNTCMTTSMPNHVTVASRITEIWRFERSLNSHDSFPRRKFENRPLTSCRSGPTLSLPTISFEIHAKVAEEIDLEMCSYGQLSEVQMLHDLDLGSGQGHINIHNTCRTTSLPNHVTVASRITEIWPYRHSAKFELFW